MKTREALVRLRSEGNQEDWSAWVNALQCDPLIWESILSSDLLEKVLALPHEKLTNWSPARLALLALGDSILIDQLCSFPYQPLPTDFRSKVSVDYEAWLCEADCTEMTISQAGSYALGLRENRLMKGSWSAARFELIEKRTGFPTVLACLYGMVPDPFDMLLAYLQPEGAQFLLHPAVHAILCQSASEQDLSILIKRLFSQIPVENRNRVMVELAIQRPKLAALLVKEIESQSETPNSYSISNQISLSDQLSGLLKQLSVSIQIAQVFRLALTPNKSIPGLVESIRATKRLQAHLAAQLACSLMSNATSADSDTSEMKDTHALEEYRTSALEAWRQATQLDPDNAVYTAGLIIALIMQGNFNDAQTLLTNYQSTEPIDGTPFLDFYCEQTSDDLSHPALIFANGLLAYNIGKFDQASRALQKLASVVHPSDELIFFYPIMANLAIGMGLYIEAVQFAQAALAGEKNNPETWSLLIRAELGTGHITRAIGDAYLAVILFPENPNLRRLLIASFDAAGDRATALDEQIKLMNLLESPDLDDYRTLANYSLAIAKIQQASLACQKSLQKNPQDGETYEILGRISLAVNESDKAYQFFSKSIQLAPYHADGWLSLARLHRLGGNSFKAIEILQAGCQAAPNSPELYLCLGETYLAEESPTLALTALKTAMFLATNQLMRSEYAHFATQVSMRNQIASLLGQTLSKLGHFEEAGEVLDQAWRLTSISDTPDVAVAQGYAENLTALGLFNQAIPLLEYVVQETPGNTDIRFELVNTLLASTDQPRMAAKAIPVLEEIISNTQIPSANQSEEIKPADTTHQQIYPVALGLLAEALTLTGEFTKAEEAFRQAMDTPLSNDPDWKLRFAIGIGQVSLALGKHETAIAALQEALTIKSSSPKVHRYLSEAYEATGLINSAIYTAEEALKISTTDIDMLIWFSEQMLGLKSLTGGSQIVPQEKAIEALHQADSLKSIVPTEILRLGKAQYEFGDHAGSLVTFSRLNDLPNLSNQVSRDDLYRASLFLISMGDIDHGINLLENAVHANNLISSSLPGYEPVSAIQLWIELAMAYLKSGNLALALNTLDKALAIEPDNTTLLFTNAHILLDAKQAKGAIKCLEKAVSLDPQNVEYLMELSLANRIYGDLPGALECSEAAINLTANSDNKSTNQFASLIAAELAISMLESQRAQTYFDIPLKCGDPLEILCAVAELYLESGELTRAGEVLSLVSPDDRDMPRFIADQLRLAWRQRMSDTADLDKLKTACERLEKPYGTLINQGGSPRPTDLPQPGNRVNNTFCWMNTLSTIRALSLTALEAGLWELAQSLANRAVEIAPYEPLTRLQKARIAIHCAEIQNRYNTADILIHAPGEEVLSEQTYQSVKLDIQAASEMVNDLSGALFQAQNGDSQSDRAYVITACREAAQDIERWRMRASAAFQPDFPNAEELLKYLATNSKDPYDIAAGIWIAGKIGDTNVARNLADGWQDEILPKVQVAIALQRKEPAEALKIARYTVEAMPEVAWPVPSPLIYGFIAITSIKAEPINKDPLVSLAAIQNALSYWPDEPSWHIHAAHLLQQLSGDDEHARISAAIDHLQHAIQLQPKQIAYRIELGKLLLNHGDVQQAIQILRQACQMAPEESECWVTLAKAYIANGDLDQATECADRAIEIAEDAFIPTLLRGEIALITNNPRGAQSRAQTLLNICPDNSECLFLLARALEAQGFMDQALLTLDKAITLTDNPFEMMLQRALILKQSKNPNSALKALHDLAERYPGDPRLLAELSEWYMENGQSDQGINTARQALHANHGELPLERQSQLHYLVGQYFRKSGHLDQAVYHLNEIIRQDPDNLEAYLELGRSHQDRRQYQQALDVFRHAIHIAPNDHRPYYAAGLALKDSKDYQEAENMLRRAASLSPQDVSIHRQLGAVVALNLVHNRRILTNEQP